MSTNTQLDLANKIENSGVTLVYIALAIIYIWFGGIKFTDGVAEGMYGMISSNPLVSWMYLIFNKQGMVNFLGTLEVIIGLLFLGRFVNPLLSALAGALSIALFIVTITMMLTLDGITTDAGFPVLSFLGEFLLKDVGLLAASLFVLGNSLKLNAAKRA